MAKSDLQERRLVVVVLQFIMPIGEYWLESDVQGGKS